MARELGAKKLPGVLVIGALARAEPLLRQLEASGRFEFNYVPTVHKAESFLLSKPSVVLLRIPAEKERANEALSYITLLRKQASVVVMSSAPNMRLYLSAMTLGAFDYFTSYTPIEEARRVLDNAVALHHRQAA